MKILWFFLIASTCMAGPVIEEEDRKVLKPFFKRLLTKETLGYVLLGEKPAVLIGYVAGLSWKHPLGALGGLTPYLSKWNQREKKAWETWRKYASAISSRFLIIEELTTDGPDVNRIYIINRKLFCKVVDENSDDFEKVLGRKISGEELLEQAKHQPLFSVLLKKHQALLGMLLGFGRNNSWRYSREEGIKELGVFPRKEDEIASIELPVFRADLEDPETKQLRQRYINCRQKIQTTFLDHEPFDEVLKILFEEEVVDK